MSLHACQRIVSESSKRLPVPDVVEMRLGHVALSLTGSEVAETDDDG